MGWPSSWSPGPDRRASPCRAGWATGRTDQTGAGDGAGSGVDRAPWTRARRDAGAHRATSATGMRSRQGTEAGDVPVSRAGLRIQPVSISSRLGELRPTRTAGPPRHPLFGGDPATRPGFEDCGNHSTGGVTVGRCVKFVCPCGGVICCWASRFWQLLRAYCSLSRCVT